MVQEEENLLKRLRAAAVMTIAVLCVLCAGAGDGSTSVSRVTIDAKQLFQTIDGFGLNFTAPYFRDDQKAMFDMFIEDLGVTKFRVVPYLIYSDWEVTNDNDDPEVMNWQYYNNRYSSPVFEATWHAIRYLNTRGIRPEIALMGPVPAWMLADKSSPPSHKVCHPSSDIPPSSPPCIRSLPRKLYRC